MPLATNGQPGTLPAVATPSAPARQTTRRWPRRVAIGTCALLIVAVLGAGLTYVYVRWRLGQIHRVNLPDLAEDKGSVMNVLLVGSDSRDRLSGDMADQAGKNQVSGQRSDTIMVLHIDAKSKKAAILSIPRDLYVRILGNGSNRVNASFAFGGAQLLIQTIKDNLGIQINHYMSVDFVGFADIVNSVGGVSVYVPAPARDAFSGLDIKNPGCISFDGEQALAWVRSRHYEYYESGRWQPDPTSDFGRIQRQQDFIRRMLRKAVASGISNPITLNRLIGIGVNDVTIDSAMSTDDLVKVARRFRSLDPGTVDMLTLPATPVTIGGADVLQLNKEEAQTYIDRLNGIEKPPPAEVQPGDIRVRVLNGNGALGAAAKASADIGRVGFKVADQGDAATFDNAHTTIRYATGQQAKADLMARYLPSGASVKEDTTLRTVDLTLTVGSDYAGVTDKPAAVPAGSPAAPAPTTTQPATGVPQPKGAPTQPSC